MRVFFLDVGQGTCNVISIGNRQAIVIDTGREYSTLKRLLHKLSIDTIAILVISHCDQDHWGGAPDLLADTTIKTAKICFHVDHKTLKTPFWTKLTEMAQAREIDPLQDLIELKRDADPHRLWPQHKLPATTEIKIYSPVFGQVVTSLMTSDVNEASGVLALHVGDKTIVFPGDSHYDQWQLIRNQHGKPFDCDIIAVPHHAGIIWDTAWSVSQVEVGMDTLYTDFVRPRHAVVSVGTSNTYGHPRDPVIKALRKAKVTVLCTQMTTQCNPNLEVRRGAPVRPLLPDIPGASLPTIDQTPSNESRNVACAGTVVVDISEKRITIHRLQEHQDGVELLKRPLPLCRQ